MSSPRFPASRFHAITLRFHTITADNFLSTVIAWNIEVIAWNLEEGKRVGLGHEGMGLMMFDSLSYSEYVPVHSTGS